MIELPQRDPGLGADPVCVQRQILAVFVKDPAVHHGHANVAALDGVAELVICER